MLHPERTIWGRSITKLHHLSIDRRGGPGGRLVWDEMGTAVDGSCRCVLDNNM